MSPRIVVCSTQEELFEAGAQCVAQSLPSGPNFSQFYSIALSGGSTPRGLFSRLTVDPYRSQVNWASVRIFWGDERPVPPDHQESNFRMAKEYLLDCLPIPTEQVFRMEGERSAEEAARRYQEVLQQTFLVKKPHVPRFDLVLLGMGPDAHTASLFPETPVLEETERWVVAPWVEKFQTRRITLTPHVFNAAKLVVFMVSGIDKATAAHAVLEGPFQPRTYPAQLINPVQGKLIWLLDQAAASQLTTSEVTEWERAKGVAIR